MPDFDLIRAGGPEDDPLALPARREQDTGLVLPSPPEPCHRTRRSYSARALMLGVILNRVDPESSLCATDYDDTYYAPGYPETDPRAGA